MTQVLDFELAAETGKPATNPYFAMSLSTEYGLGLERSVWAGHEVRSHPGSTGANHSLT